MLITDVQKSKQNFATKSNFYNQLSYVIERRLSRLNTLKLCMVIAYHSATNTIDVRPMLYDTDGSGNQIEQGILYGVPVMQIQGGTSGVKVEYAVNDIVLCAWSDKDIQGLKRSKKISAPTTDLITPLNSAICVGAVLYNDATVYIKVTDKIYLTGDVEVSGSIKSAGYTTGSFSGIDTTFVDGAGVTHVVKKGLIVS